MTYRIVEYVKNSSVHGIRYIGNTKLHWTERIFWIFVCCSSGYYTWIFLLNTIDVFRNNAVSFVVETDYLRWNTTFPAVSICEQESPDKLDEVSKKFYGENRDANYDFFVRDITFFDGSCYSCSNCFKSINCTEDFDFLVSRVKQTCNKLLNKCSWNEKLFDCCDNFLPLLTENGLCYTINSMQTTKTPKTMPKLVSNRFTGLGKLRFQAFESIRLFIHSAEDVPYINHPKDEKALLDWGSTFVMKFRVNEIENDRYLPLVPIDRRDCRLPNENELNVYKFYSYSACIVDCRSRVQKLLCNCTSHYTPFYKSGEGGQERVATCGIAGFVCLTEHVEVLKALKKADLKNLGIDECQCISSCTEPEYKIISSEIQLKKDDSSRGSQITINLERLPTKRYKRTVVRTRLDLLVSIGSIFGLFLGASVLSIVELVYFLCVRVSKFDSSRSERMEFDKRTATPATVLFKISPLGTSYRSIRARRNKRISVK